MTTPSQQTSEPQDAFSRIMSGPSNTLAGISLILGVVNTLLFFYRVDGGGLTRRVIDIQTPPSIITVNLSFLVMLLAVTTLYRIRKLPNQTLPRVAGIIALFLGLAGPALYSLQTVQWRSAIHQLEVSKVQKIITAINQYTQSHHGAFPASLDTLITTKQLTPSDLISPFNQLSPDQDPTHSYSDRSDYEYLGAGLIESKLTQPYGEFLILVISKKPRMKAFLTVGWANGTVKLIENTDLDVLRRFNNNMRSASGLPLLQPPTTAPATQPH